MSRSITYAKVNNTDIDMVLDHKLENASLDVKVSLTVIEETLEFILTERNPKESVNYAKFGRAAQTLIDANAIATVPVLAEFIVSTRGQNNSSRRTALTVVSAIGDSNVVDLLVEEYDSARSGWEIAVDGLRRLAPRKFSKKLLQDIQSGEITYSYKNSYNKSIKAFVQVGDSSMIPEVIALLDSPQRVAAARILYWMPDKRAIPALRKALTLPGAHNFSTHAYAAHALHYLGIDEGLEVLIRDLYEVPRTVNPHSTGRAIAAIAGEGALELYRPILEDSNSRARRNALVAMQWLLDNTDHSAPHSSVARRKVSVMQPDAGEEFLQLCYPLLADEDSTVAAEARRVFMSGIQALGQDHAVDKGLAVSIAKILWSEFFTDPQRQKQLLRGRPLVYPLGKKGRPVVLMFSKETISRSEEDNELSQHSGSSFALPSQKYFVLCTDDEIRITKTDSPDTDGQKAARIWVRKIYQAKPFYAVTMGILTETIDVLLRQEDGDWKWGALLGHTHIDIF